MSFNPFRFLLISTVLLIISDKGFGQSSNLEAKIQEIMIKYKAVGLSVVVVKKNAIVYTHAFGQKSIERNEPLSEDGLFRIASISKSFSATSIMQLIAAKKLSLNDDFSKLVGFQIRNPKFPDKVITLKMVMSHTSSLNDDQGYFNLDVVNPAKSKDWEKCYNAYEPGTGYQYCNLNYNMVGAVIERVTGMRFDQYIITHILNPMHLYGGYDVDSLDANRFVTLYEYAPKMDVFVTDLSVYASHSKDLKTYVLGYSTPLLSPTGGMKITATDLAKYMMMHMNYGKSGEVKIMPRHLSRLMQKPVAKDAGYGLAIRTLKTLIPGKTMKGHTGNAYGLYSAMFFNPKEKFGFVVITNGCSTGEIDAVNPLSKDIINYLYEAFLK